MCAMTRTYARVCADEVSVLRPARYPRMCHDARTWTVGESRTLRHPRSTTPTCPTLQVLRAQVEEQRQKAEDGTTRRQELCEMQQIVSKTLTPLQREREKVRLLLCNFSPETAQALDAEFGFE